MKSLKYLFLFILFSSNSLLSQENVFFTPFNLDFEIGSQYNTPFAWIVSDNSLKLRYNAFVDDKEFYSGRNSMVLFNYGTITEDMYGNCYQMINSLPFKGGEVEFSCFAKTDFTNDSSGATFWLKEFDIFHNVINESVVEIKETSDWTKNSFTHKFSSNTNYFQVGVLLNYLGAVWIDNMKINPIYNIQNEIQITNNNFNQDILKFTKAYSKVRNFFPIADYNWNKFLVESIENIASSPINNKNLFKSISPSISFNEKNPNINVSNESKYFWKHLGGRSNFSYGYSFSEFKDINISDREREAVLMHNIDVTGDGGRRFKWSAWVKTKLDSYAAHAQLWTRVITKEGRELNLYMHDNPIKVGEWTKFEVDSILPENATRATIGCVFFGEGTAWFDDIEFSVYDEINREKYLLSNSSFESFDKEQKPKSWIFPNSVRRAGYNIEQDFKIFKKGKSSAKISSDDLYRYTYPKNNEIYSSKEVSFPLCSPNNDKANFENQFINDVSIQGRIAILIEAYAYIDQFLLNGDKSELDMSFASIISSIESNENVFLKELKKLFAVLKDPQTKVWKENDTIIYSPNLMWDFYENELIVTSSGIKNLPIGSKIELINSKPVETIVNENSTINNSNNEILNKYRALEEFKIGAKNTSFSVQVNGKSIDLIRDTKIDQLTDKFRPDLSKLSDSTLYINMAKVNDETMKSILADLNDFNTLVFDARGNSLLSEHFLAFFLQEDIKTNTFKLPLFSMPDQKNNDFLELRTTIKAKNQYPNKKLIFLVDERTSGYCESIIYSVKKYKLGLIIGEPSSGMPSEKVYFALPGEYRFQTSISDVYDSDDKYINNFIIQPDLIVKDRIEFIDKPFDYVIEKSKLIDQ